MYRLWSLQLVCFVVLQYKLLYYTLKFPPLVGFLENSPDEFPVAFLEGERGNRKDQHVFVVPDIRVEGHVEWASRVAPGIGETPQAGHGQVIHHAR